MTYIVKEIYFKEGKPVNVQGKIIHVQEIMGSQHPDHDADYCAICLIERGGD